MTSTDSSPGTPHLSARDRHAAAASLVRSPEERLQAMQELIAGSWAMLEANPEGLAHFLRRNYKARAIAVVHDRGHHVA
ncbi:MAG: hypothetical protein WD060_12000 [Pirellulales bacterium]